MKNLFKDSFNLIKYNSIFIQPILLLFIVLTYSEDFVFKLRGSAIPYSTMLASLLLLCVAVSAGWFYINALAVKGVDKKYESNQERYQDVSQTFGKFFVGVGENFLKSLFVNILVLLLFVGCSYCLFRWGSHHVGSLRIVFDIINAVNANPDADVFKLAQEFYTPQNTIILAFWTLSSFALLSIISFIYVLYNAAMFLDKTNPFKALLDMIVFSFKNFFTLIFLFIVTILMNVAINIITTLSSINFILSIFGILLIFFYINYFVFLIFLFYERYSKKNNCDCGTKLDREV